MQRSCISLNKASARGALRKPHWGLAVLGTSLIVFLSACEGAPVAQNQPARPKIHVVPLSTQEVEARTNAQTLLQQFRQSISQAEQRGLNVASYRMQLDEDQQEFQNAQSAQAYSDLATAIDGQKLSLKKGLTRYDLQDLETLIGTTDINNDYEYRDAVDAYLNQQKNFQNPQTLDALKAVDFRARFLGQTRPG